MKQQGLPSAIHRYFLEYLPRHKGLQSSTIRSYRDSLRLFLIFVADANRIGVSELAFEHLGYAAVQDFLNNMEVKRGNAISTRNQRLTALHMFYEYLGRTTPEMLPASAKVAAIPMKRCPLPEMKFLARDEVEAMFALIPAHDRLSQRDRALLMLLYNTGARVSEIVGVRVVDVVLDGAACVHLHGKGRKDRSVPLWKTTAAAIRAWLNANPHLRDSAALLPNRSGHPMTRCNVAQRLALAVDRASAEQPSLKTKRISPHTLRHTTAMHLLQSGVPFNVIALWLGHESTNTTHRYVEANLEMKEKALARLEAPDIKLKRFRAGDELMRFLQTL